jgi:hypothetical protein
MDVFLFQVLQSLSEPPCDHSPPSISPKSHFRDLRSTPHNRHYVKYSGVIVTLSYGCFFSHGCYVRDLKYAYSALQGCGLRVDHRM